MKKYIIFLLFIGVNLYSQNKGIEIYSVKSVINPNKDCHKCFEINKEILSAPIFSPEDIDHFDWEEQKFVLTAAGEQKINALNIPLSGLPVVFVVDGEPIYGFWFWTSESSFGCDRVVTYPKLAFTLEFGLPSDYTFGDDPRYDTRIKKYLDTHKP